MIMMHPTHPLTRALSIKTLAAFSLTCALFTATSPQAEAVLLAYDGFGVGGSGYTDNAAINGQGHGTGWSETWSAGVDYVTKAGSIAPSNVQSEDGLVSFGNVSSTESIGRVYDANFSTNGGGDYSEGWASWVVQRNNTRDFKLNPFANANTGNGQYMGIHALNGSNTLYAEIRYAGSASIEQGTSFEMTTSTTYFMVAQALVGAGPTPDVFNVWIIDASAYDGTISETPTITVSYDMEQTYTAMSMTNQNPLGEVDAVLFDEFRLGTTFSDVSGVPEPSTYAVIFGLAAGMLALYRQRRRDR